MMRWLKKINAFALSTMILSSCGNEKPKTKELDTPTSGTLNISVDETYKPVMDEEIKVFMSNFPEATD